MRQVGSSKSPNLGRLGKILRMCLCVMMGVEEESWKTRMEAVIVDLERRVREVRETF